MIVNWIDNTIYGGRDDCNSVNDQACDSDQTCALVEHRSKDWSFESDLYNSTVRLRRCIDKSFLTDNEGQPYCPDSGVIMNSGEIEYSESNDKALSMSDLLGTSKSVKNIHVIKAYCL